MKRIAGIFLAALLALTVLPHGAELVTSDDVTKGIVTTAYAEDEHKHCLCATEDGTHKGECNGTDVIWTPYSGGSVERGTADNPKYYYLTNNVEIKSGWQLTAQCKYIVICLNGYSITSESGQTINITSGGEIFTITDCKPAGQQGKITHTEGNGVGVFVNNSIFNMYGGCISGNTNTSGNGGGVSVVGTFNMYGGTISENTGASGGGVRVGSDNIRGTFNMYGGTISGNTADVYGGGVFVSTGAKFTMSGDASITANTAGGADSDSYGGGVYSKGTFNLNGGTITNNKADGKGNVKGGGVCSYGTFNVSGNPIVSGNAKINETQSVDNVESSEKDINIAGALTGAAEIVVNSSSISKITGNDAYYSTATNNDNSVTLKAPTGSSGGETTVAVTGVTLDKTAATVGVGKTVTLTATVMPANAADKSVTWTSSDAGVASVDTSGVVTGVKAGTATITAKAGDKTATCMVTVTSGEIDPGTGGEVTPGTDTTPRYYYNATTAAEGKTGSPKTFDAGVGIYAVSAVLSLTGMAYVGKKKF